MKRPGAARASSGKFAEGAIDFYILEPFCKNKPPLLNKQAINNLTDKSFKSWRNNSIAAHIHDHKGNMPHDLTTKDAISRYYEDLCRSLAAKQILLHF